MATNKATPIYRKEKIGELHDDQHSDHGMMEAAFLLIGGNVDDTFSSQGVASYTFNAPGGAPVTVDVAYGV